MATTYLWSGFRLTRQQWRGSVRTKTRRVNTYFFFQLGRRQEMSFVCDGKIFILIFLLGVLEEVTTSHLTCILWFIKKKKKWSRIFMAFWHMRTRMCDKSCCKVMIERQMRERRSDAWTGFLIFHHVKQWLWWKPLLLRVGLPTSVWSKEGGGVQKNGRPCLAAARALMDSSITVEGK